MPQFPLFPEQASTLAGDVDLLFLGWVLVSLISSLLVGGLVLYFALRYRRRKADQVGTDEHAPAFLEIAWSVIPLVICLGFFFWGAKVFFAIARPPANAVEYFVTGKQWMWKVQHPSGVREINHLHVPVGVPIKLTMTSEDVIHSFFMPAFRVKQDVLPGYYSTVWFEATKTGRYHLFCAEYCGVEHSKMGGWITVMTPDEYEAWLGGGPASKPPAELGKELFSTLACNTCHMAGDTQRGPKLDGLYGSQVQLANGRVVEADDNYLRESIVNPGAKQVAGFDLLMPMFQGQLSAEQLNALIAYIKSLPKTVDGPATALIPAAGEPAAAPN